MTREATLMSIDGWMDEEVVHIYESGILPAIKMVNATQQHGDLEITIKQVRDRKTNIINNTTTGI